MSPFDEEDCMRQYGEQLDAYEEAARKEIHALFRRGFAGESVILPDAYIGRDGEWERRDTVSFSAALAESVDCNLAREWILRACRRTGHDLTAAMGQFMRACADEYCNTHASDIAKAAMDGEIGEAWENRL